MSGGLAGEGAGRPRNLIMQFRVRFGEFDFVPPLVSYAEFAISPRFLHDSLRETGAALHNFLEPVVQVRA
jgi:hypothetical protein